MARYKITKVYIPEAENEDEALRLWFTPDKETEYLEFESLEVRPTTKRRWLDEWKELVDHDPLDTRARRTT